MRTHEGWSKARPLKEFFADRKSRGESWGQATEHLKFLEISQEAYGDWRLYVDDNGNYYEDYFSIGD